MDGELLQSDESYVCYFIDSADSTNDFRAQKQKAIFAQTARP
jgi:hypothetical protein